MGAGAGSKSSFVQACPNATKPVDEAGIRLTAARAGCSDQSISIPPFTSTVSPAM